jgi:hypothetical protein
MFGSSKYGKSVKSSAIVRPEAMDSTIIPTGTRIPRIGLVPHDRRIAGYAPQILHAHIIAQGQSRTDFV